MSQAPIPDATIEGIDPEVVYIYSPIISLLLKTKGKLKRDLHIKPSTTHLSISI